MTRQFKDYSEWMTDRDLSDQKKYWLTELGGELPVLDIPTDFARAPQQSFRGASVEMSVGTLVKNRIEQFAKETQTTEFMVFLSAIMILLSKYSRQDDILIGSAVSSRRHKDTESMIGMFSNTVVLRGEPKQNKLFEEFLEEIKGKCLHAYENQEFPFEELVEAVVTKRDLTRNPLFDVMFNLYDHENAVLDLNGIFAEFVDSDDGITKFDLSFSVSKTKVDYTIYLQYCTELYKRETAEGLLRHLYEVLMQVTGNKQIQLGKIAAITQWERELILGEFNDTYEEYARNSTVVAMFEEQVERTPDNIALVFDDEAVTYKQLNARANQLANRLRELGVGPDHFVAIAAERSIEMIVGIYGIIKAGGAYVPIDPEYPKERIRYILDDCKPKALLVYRVEVEAKTPVIDLAKSELYTEAPDNIERVNGPEDLIYCIYTSGTTGNPKGVMITHQGLVNYLSWCTQAYAVAEGQGTLVHSPLGFDLTVTSLLSPLMVGQKAILLPEGVGVEELHAALHKGNDFSLVKITPAHLKLLSQVLSPEDASHARALIIGGEALRGEDVAFWQTHAPKTRLINEYGPTETVVGCSIYEVPTGTPLSGPISIGRPIWNTQIYILNGEDLCGVGVPGELCIAGDGLAREYLNQPELTAEKFVRNPFGEGRIYRSGDLARWLSDGNIEFLGRIDEQIKIRGFRIELGEIENKLRGIPGIRHAVAIAREDSEGDKAIYAYIVSEVTVSINEIREQLSKVLPEYMVPSYMMQIAKIPVTKNGKIDKRALPEIEAKSDMEYEEPQTPEENVLCEVFRAVLKNERIGRNDNFFEMGGDSIKTIRAVSRVRERGYKLTLGDVMRRGTVKRIAQAMRQDAELAYEQDEVTGRIHSTPMIKSFFDNNYAEPQHYNQSILLKLDGADEQGIRRVLTEVVTHHDVLRSVCRENGLEILSVEHSELFEYSELEVGGAACRDDIERACTRIQRSMNLQYGPLVKAARIRTEGGDYLFVCIHHLVVDGVSWRILIEDIYRGLDQYNRGCLITFPSKTASFKVWAELIAEYSESGALGCERGYWEEVKRKIGEGRIENDSSNESGLGQERIDFTREVTDDLLYRTNKAYHTEINDVLLAALGMAVRGLTGQEKLAVMMEGHGRHNLHKRLDIDRTVGWFTNKYPVIVQSKGNIQDDLIGTKEMLRQVPNNGMGYGLLGLPAESTSILFNYMGEIDAEYVQEYGDDLPTGENVSSYNHSLEPIIVNGEIMNGCLSFYMKYQKDRISSEIIKKLCSLYKQCLEEIIIHCTTNSRLTKADLDWRL